MLKIKSIFSSLFSLFKIQNGWEHVRGFANSPIIKLTILMPVFGYTILFNDTLSKHFELSTQLVDNSIYGHKEKIEKSETVISIQTKFRLYAFYFGLSFLGVGSLIYAFYCSPIIKKYESINAIISDHIQTIEPVIAKWYFDVYISHSKIYSADYKANMKIELDDAETYYNRESDSNNIFNKSVKDLLRDVWASENVKNQKSLHLTSFFFKLGFVILAIPTVELFVNVIFSLF